MDLTAKAALAGVNEAGVTAVPIISSLAIFGNELDLDLVIPAIKDGIRYGASLAGQLSIENYSQFIEDVEQADSFGEILATYDKYYSIAAAMVGGIGGVKAIGKSRSATLTQKGVEHIVKRHWPTSGEVDAGKFSAGTSLRSLRDMIRTGTASGSSRPNTHNRPGEIIEHDFGRRIGTDINGNSTSRLRIVVINGEVITAFPY